MKNDCNHVLIENEGCVFGNSPKTVQIRKGVTSGDCLFLNEESATKLE
jgi:hypothetical protein